MYLVDGERRLVKQQRRLRILLAIHGNIVSLLIVSFALAIVLIVVATVSLLRYHYDCFTTVFSFWKRAKYTVVIHPRYVLLDRIMFYPCYVV